MSVAPAAPAVPALAYLVVGLLLMLAWAVQRGLLAIWIHTFGAILLRLADLLTIDVSFVHIHLGGPLLRLNDTVRNGLVAGASKAEHGAGYFFHGCAVIVRWMAGEIEDLAGETYAWAEWFQKAHLPRLLKAAIYAAFPPLLIARLVKAAIHAHLPHIGRTVIYKAAPAAKAAVTKVIHATSGAVAIPGWVIRLPGRVGHIERDLSGLRKRLKSVEKIAGATAAVALFTAALAKLGLHWLRCRNVTKTGKRVCALDSGLLDALLIGTTLIVGTISLREFAREVEAVTEEAAGLVRGFIRET